MEIEEDRLEEALAAKLSLDLTPMIPQRLDQRRSELYAHLRGYAVRSSMQEMVFDTRTVLDYVLGMKDEISKELVNQEESYKRQIEKLESELRLEKEKSRKKDERYQHLRIQKRDLGDDLERAKRAKEELETKVVSYRDEIELLNDECDSMTSDLTRQKVELIEIKAELARSECNARYFEERFKFERGNVNKFREITMRVIHRDRCAKMSDDLICSLRDESDQ